MSKLCDTIDLKSCVRENEEDFTYEVERQWTGVVEAAEKEREGFIQDIVSELEKSHVIFREKLMSDSTKTEVYRTYLAKGLIHEIERGLGLETSDVKVKMGIVDDRFYVWKIDRTPNDMLNVWGDRYFYLKEQEYENLIERFGNALQLPKNKSERAQHINKLIRSMISDDPFCQIMRRKGKSRLLGDMLHFVRDALEYENDHFEGKITKVTSRYGRGPILNPKLPTGEDLSLIRSQLGAIVNSDCWLCNDGRMYYYEADLDRIRIVQELFQKLGDIELRMEHLKVNRSYRMLLPRHIGRAFIYWGFTTDDKAINNGRLAEGIRIGSRNDWIAYLRELIPEDGSINEMSGFQWSRSIVLNPGSQDEKYELSPKLEKHHISFIKDNGRHDKKRGYIHLQLAKYLKLGEKSKPDIFRNIESVFSDNRCKLIDDEVSLAENLGIEMRVYPESITFYEKTGRISIKWVATTSGAENAIKWYLIAPPHDVKKNGKAKEWMSLRQEEVERIKGQLEADGLL